MTISKQLVGYHSLDKSNFHLVFTQVAVVKLLISRRQRGRYPEENEARYPEENEARYPEEKEAKYLEETDAIYLPITYEAHIQKRMNGTYLVHQTNTQQQLVPTQIPPHKLLLSCLLIHDIPTTQISTRCNTGQAK